MAMWSRAPKDDSRESNIDSRSSNAHRMALTQPRSASPQERFNRWLEHHVRVDNMCRLSLVEDARNVRCTAIDSSAIWAT